MLNGCAFPNHAVIAINSSCNMDVNSVESVVNVCIAISILLLSFHLLHYLFIDLHSTEISFRYKVLCCTFSMTCIPLTICNWSSNIAVDEESQFILDLFFNVFYIIVNVTLYLIIDLRYYETFKHSPYRPSNRTQCCLLALITAYFMIYSLWIITYLLSHHRDAYIYSLPVFLILFISEMFLLLIDLILTVCITYLFCRNLILLAASIGNSKETVGKSIHREIEFTDTSLFSSSVQRPASTNTIILPVTSTPLMSSSLDCIKYENEDSVHLNGNQQRLISLTVRLIVLTVPAMISTSVVWIVSLTAWYLDYFVDNDGKYRQVHEDKVYWTLRVIIIPIDTVLNFLCVYLAFDFVSHWYKRICCVSEICENLFKIAIKKRITSKH